MPTTLLWEWGELTHDRCLTHCPAYSMFSIHVHHDSCAPSRAIRRKKQQHSEQRKKQLLAMRVSLCRERDTEQMKFVIIVINKEAQPGYGPFHSPLLLFFPLFCPRASNHKWKYEWYGPDGKASRQWDQVPSHEICMIHITTPAQIGIPFHTWKKRSLHTYIDTKTYLYLG